MPGKREGVPTWDQTFMSMAEVISWRSKDPSTQVGACIVGRDHRILSLGYNGTTRGFNDDDFPWEKSSSDPNQTKYPFVVHAERNAILNFNGSLRDFNDAIMYATHMPCNECAKSIAQVGISELVFLHNYDKMGSSSASSIIFERAGITVRQMLGLR